MEEQLELTYSQTQALEKACELLRSKGCRAVLFEQELRPDGLFLLISCKKDGKAYELSHLARLPSHLPPMVSHLVQAAKELVEPQPLPPTLNN